MSYEYRVICDVCNKETKGFSTDAFDNKEVAKNKFQLRMDNHWLEDTEAADKKLLHDTKIDMDLCGPCAVRLKEHIDAIVKDMKKNAK